MAAGAKTEAHNNSDSGISNDGVDDILDHRNSEDRASNLGSIQHIRDLKGKEKA